MEPLLGCRPTLSLATRLRALVQIQPGPLPHHRIDRRYIQIKQLNSHKVVFSAIQSTGIPHVGNWLGTLKQWVSFQKSEARLVFAVADLHSITVPQDASVLRRWRRETLAALIAVGLRPDRCTIFFQSDVPAHTELMWSLSCISSMGYLMRMTTWKSKMPKDDNLTKLDNITSLGARMGLLAYPVLQAADILAHGAHYVPVGSDQTQHLEFARECARNFNKTYGCDILQVPTALYSRAPRIMSLRDPSCKMSKSHIDPKSRILITDTANEIRRKINGSLTDSLLGVTYDPIERPGVANLIQILCCLDGDEKELSAMAAELENTSLKALKQLLAERLNSALEPVRERFRELTESNDGRQTLDIVSREGKAAASESAIRTVDRVYRAMGLR